MGILEFLSRWKNRVNYIGLQINSEETRLWCYQNKKGNWVIEYKGEKIAEGTEAEMFKMSDKLLSLDEETMMNGGTL